VQAKRSACCFKEKLLWVFGVTGRKRTHDGSGNDHDELSKHHYVAEALVHASQRFDEQVLVCGFLAKLHRFFVLSFIRSRGEQERKFPDVARTITPR
jgi:hypothetical protein